MIHLCSTFFGIHWQRSLTPRDAAEGSGAAPAMVGKSGVQLATARVSIGTTGRGVNTSRIIDTEGVLALIPSLSRSTWGRWRAIGKAPVGKRLPNGRPTWLEDDILYWWESLPDAA
jgi:hypothetical protein